MLKTEGQNQWAKNVQLTFWIGSWLALFALPETAKGLFSAGVAGAGSGGAAAAAAGLKASLAAALAGVEGWVWPLIFLQGLKCLLVPATLKYSALSPLPPPLFPCSPPFRNQS